MGHAGGPGISVAILSWPSAAVALETQHMPVTITTVGTISKDEVLLKRLFQEHIICSSAALRGTIRLVGGASGLREVLFHC